MIISKRARVYVWEREGEGEGEVLQNRVREIDFQGPH